MLRIYSSGTLTHAIVQDGSTVLTEKKWNKIKETEKFSVSKDKSAHEVILGWVKRRQRLISVFIFKDVFEKDIIIKRSLIVPKLKIEGRQVRRKPVVSGKKFPFFSIISP